MFAKKSIVLHTAHNNRPRNQRTATVIYKTSHRDIHQKRNAMSVKKSIVLNIVAISTMFGSSLSLIVCRKAHVLFTLFVYVLCRVVSNTYCVVFVVLIVFVLCTLCW